MARSSPFTGRSRSTALRTAPSSFFARLHAFRDRQAQRAVDNRTYHRDADGQFASGGSGGVRDVIANAKTTADLQKVMAGELGRALGHDVTVKLNMLDLPLAKVHMEGVLRGAERFPGANLHAIDTAAQGTMMMARHREGTLTFTTELKLDSFTREMDNADRTGHFAGTKGDLTRLATHEFGHNVSYTLGREPDQIVRRHLDRDNAEHPGQPRDQPAADLSRYSLTSDNEAFAEVFADVVSRGDDAVPFAKAVMADVDALAAAPRASVTVRPVARTYKRDSKGRFGSGSGLGEHGPVRDELRAATTTVELNDALAGGIERITGRRIPVEMAGSDLQIAREHGEGILRALERFPDAPLAEVRVVGRPDTAGPGRFGQHDPRQAQDTWDYLSLGGAMAATTQHLDGPRHGQRLLISRDYAGDPARYDAALRESARGGHFVAASPVGIALHEMGHVVARGGRSATAGKRAATAEAKARGVKPSALVRSEVSHYAASSIHELSGEAFADVMVHGDGASATSKLVFAEVASRAPGRGDMQAPKSLLRSRFFALLEQRRVANRTYKRDKDGRFGTGGDGGARGIREVFTGPKTITSLEQAAAAEFERILGQRVAVKLQGLDMDAARAHMEGVARGAEMFPETDLISVTSYGPGGILSAVPNTPDQEAAWGVTASTTNRAGADIMLNTRIDAERMRTVTRRATESGRQHGDPDDITRTGAHEFGHAAAASLRRGEAQGAAVDILIRQEGAARSYEHLYGAISRYAGTDPDELLGEAVAQVASRGDKASPVAREIVASIQTNWDAWKI